MTVQRKPINTRSQSSGETIRLGPVIVSALSWIIAGCVSTTPIVLKMNYEADVFRASETGKADGEAACEIRIVRVEDRRSEKESLGVLGYSPVRAEGVTDWVATGIRRQTPSRNIRTVGNGSATFDLEVGVKKLFIQENTLRLHGVVLIEVAVRDGPGDPGVKIYRGDAGRLAWTNSRSELQDVLNRALDDAVGQLAGDLKPQCRPT